MRAEEKGHDEIVKVLIKAGADVNVKNDDGDTALMRAEEKGHDEIVKILKAAGAR